MKKLFFFLSTLCYAGDVQSLTCSFVTFPVNNVTNAVVKLVVNQPSTFMRFVSFGAKKQITQITWQLNGPPNMMANLDLVEGNKNVFSSSFGSNRDIHTLVKGVKIGKTSYPITCQ